MATSGTPHEGKDNVVVPAVYTGLQLVLYTNTADSLDEDTVLADLTQPTGETGYGAITLSGVWSSTDGVVTYDHGTPDDPAFENTGGSNWSVQPTGAAITDGTYILHFKDFADGAQTVQPGQKVIIDLSSLVG